MDPDIALHLRRLSKRDPLTRAKALVALRELVPEKGQAAVLAALPSWTHTFPRLVADNNRWARFACSETGVAWVPPNK